MTVHTAQGSKVAFANDFNQLGARLVRFGHALQEGSTTAGELMALAQACGINFKLRVVAESEGRDDE